MKIIKCSHCNNITLVQNMSPGITVSCDHCHTPLTTFATNADLDDNPLCPVCCSPISDGDISVVCSLCNTEYHEECWQENKGCATYGCPNTGCLSPQASTKPTYGETPISTPPLPLPGVYDKIPQPSGSPTESPAADNHLKVTGLTAAVCLALSFAALIIFWITGYLLKWLGETLAWIGVCFISFEVKGPCFIIGTLTLVAIGSIMAYRDPEKIKEWSRKIANITKQYQE